MQILVFIGIALGIYGILHSIGSTKHPYKNHLDRLEIYSNCDEFESAKVGNSHVGGLNFQELGEKGFSPFIGGSDLFESIHQAKTVVEQCKNVNKIYFAVSPFILLIDNSLLLSLSDVRKRNYACNPSWRLIDWDIKNAILGRMSPVVRTDHWEPFFRRKNGFTKYEFDFNDKRETDLDVHASLRLRKISNILVQMEEVDSYIQQRSAEYLNQFVRWISTMPIELIFFTPTYYHLYSTGMNDHLGPDRVAYRDSVFHVISEKYNVKYYDFSEMPDLSFDKESFLNSDHLNLEGSIRMTRKYRDMREVSDPH